MRPRTIIWFEALLVTSLLGPLLQQAAFWDEIKFGMIPPSEVAVTLLLSVAIPLLLALRVSRGRSVMAKWVLVPLFAISTAGSLLMLLSSDTPGRLLAIGLVTAVVQTAAIALLFTASARAWLGRTDEPVSPRALEKTFE